VLEFAVDQHSLVAGQYARFFLHAGHLLSITKRRLNVSPFPESIT
jgi:hypothetical protein